MLDEGTRIQFQDTTGKEGTVTATVKSCSRRGTTCQVELDSGETERINFSKVQYEVLEQPQSTDKTAAIGVEKVDGGSLDEGEENASLEAAADKHSPLGNGHTEAGSSGEDKDEEDEEGVVGNIAGENSEDEEDEWEEDLLRLDAFEGDTATCLDAFAEAARGPDVFLWPNAELAGLARLAAKALYDYTSSAEPVEGTLPELYVDGFDAEQIWVQLDSQTGPALKRIRRLLQKLSPDMRLVDPDMEAALAELLDEDASDESDEAGEESEQAAGESDEATENDLSESDDDSLNRDDSHKMAAARKRKAPPVELGELASRRVGEQDAGGKEELKPTEDRFMRLDDMERFVQDAEEAAMKGSDDEQPGTDDDNDDDDDEDEGEEGGGLENPEDGDSDEEDAELARLLESASNMVGRTASGKAAGKRGRTAVADDDSDDEAGGADIMYEDFFGQGGQASAGQRAHGRRKGSGLNSDMEDGDVEQSDEDGLEDDLDEDFDEDLDAPEPHEDRILERAGSPPQEESDGPDVGREAGGGKLSAHERRLARMANRARQLEQANIGEKDWYMRGEAAAGARPLNSALEIDLDFDRAVKPPPQPTEESTATLEDMIKQRIGERRFDDPETRAPPADDLQKELVELDDKRPQKGLGEVYEEDYVRAATGNALEDKDDKVRSETKLLLKGLFAKLDALSHFHYAPKPVIKEVTVQKDVPALAMEEVAPQVVSEAARQLPEEVFRPAAAGMPKSEAELTHGDRRRRRAAKKRAFKKHSLQKEEERKVRGATQDGVSNVIGRKSASADSAALVGQKGKKKRPSEDKPAKIDYTKSAAVFGQLQDAREAAASGAPKAKKARSNKGPDRSSALKL